MEAGAGAVQLFDSWVGSLSAADYARFVQPHSAHVLEAIGQLGVPRIHFGVGTGELLRPMAAAGADVVGVDWRIPLDEADRRLGHRYALQGNLDPALLGAPWPVVAERTRAVVTAGASAPGHVFNLGHGVPPDTDPAVLQRIVDLVHEEGGDLRRAAAGHDRCRRGRRRHLRSGGGAPSVTGRAVGAAAGGSPRLGGKIAASGSGTWRWTAVRSPCWSGGRRRRR